MKVYAGKRSHQARDNKEKSELLARHQVGQLQGPIRLFSVALSQVVHHFGTWREIFPTAFPLIKPTRHQERKLEGRSIYLFAVRMVYYIQGTKTKIIFRPYIPVLVHLSP